MKCLMVREDTNQGGGKYSDCIVLHTTWGFVQVGHDVVTSVKYKHRQQFRLDEQSQATD